MKFASLFSGCGGFDIGFIESGFSPRAAYDMDQAACLNFSKNIDSQIYNCDLSVSFPEKSKIKNIDVLLAGPPCQGFSTAGKRDFNDARNHLVTLTGELAKEISPKVLVVENVPGVLSGGHSIYWKNLEETMRCAGYQTNTIVCQTDQLGMAQSRKRVLLFAWKAKGISDFEIPLAEPQTIREAISGVRGLPNHNPRRLVIDSRDWKIARRIKQGQKLSNVRGGNKSVATWDIPEVFGSVTDNERTVLEMLRRLRRQDRVRTYGDADPVCLTRLETALGTQFKSHLNCLIEKGFARRVGDRVDLSGTFNGKYRRLRFDGNSSTVDTRFGSPRYFLHPEYHRGFTVREAARLQGFGDDYVFLGSEQSQFRVIGNAVPPPLGVLAAKISRELLGA